MDLGLSVGAAAADMMWGGAITQAQMTVAPKDGKHGSGGKDGKDGKDGQDGKAKDAKAKGKPAPTRHGGVKFCELCERDTSSWGTAKKSIAGIAYAVMTQLTATTARLQRTRGHGVKCENRCLTPVSTWGSTSRSTGQAKAAAKKEVGSQPPCFSPRSLPDLGSSMGSEQNKKPSGSSKS